MILKLPFPPSVNHYYRHWGHKVLISKAGRNYRALVAAILQHPPQVHGDVRFAVSVYPPDRRRRDLDNLLKGLQDSLVHAGLLGDDSQIKELHMVMCEPLRPGGRVVVEIAPLGSQVTSEL